MTKLRHPVSPSVEPLPPEPEPPLRDADHAPRFLTPAPIGDRAGRRVWPALRAVLRQHRRALLATMLLVLATAAVAAFTIPRRFTAHADLWLDHGFDEVVPVAPAPGVAADPRPRNTEVRVVTSSGIVATVVDKLGLANVRGVGQPRDGALIPRDEARRIAIATVRDNLAVDAAGTSYAVAVRYAAPDPVLATGILNQLLDTYVEDRRSGGARGRERDRMRAEVAAARDAALRAQAAFEGYRAATDVVRSAQDATLIRSEIEALDAELRTAKARQTSAEARLAGIRNAGDGTRIANLRAQQARLVAERTSMTGTNPALDTRITALGRDIAAETARTASLAAEARAAADRTTLITAARTRVENQLRESVEAANQLRLLGQGATEARARFASLSERLAAHLAAQRTAPGTAYVIARATPAAARSFPGPALFVAGGLAAALLAAALVAGVLEALVKGFRSRQQLEHRLGIPVIGMVPDAAKLPDADMAADDPMGPPDYLYNHPRSAFGAAFRSIHAGLRLGGGAHALRSIAICSALQSEGKTTVAICLARSAALAGLRVVLVDADARRPAASRALSAHVETGLAEVLAGQASIREALQRDTPSGAWFLAQGNATPAPPAALAADAMAGLVAKLAQEFDLVIIDTPPALALMEARAVAAMADGVLLVARARTTPVEATRIAQDMLLRAGATIAGAALTFADP